MISRIYSKRTPQFPDATHPARLNAFRRCSLPLAMGAMLLSALLTVSLVSTLASAPLSAQNLDSSDEIEVADGLQLPDYGVLWCLDTWKGVKELVQLDPAIEAEHLLSLPNAHRIDLKGEAAGIRIHDKNTEFFMRGVTENGNAPAGFIIVPLSVDGNRRRAAKTVSQYLAGEKKRRNAVPGAVVELAQKRIGFTDWYRLTPARSLEPGEYALVPLPSDSAAVADGVHDFAIDPEARENRKAIRSEKDRQLE